MSASPPIRQVLLLGDSTALGVDSGDPLSGIPHCIASDFPHSRVTVKAGDAMHVHDLARQFPRDSRVYDVLLIMCGGPDVLHFTPLRRISRILRQVIALARERSPLVIVANGTHLGAAPLRHWPVESLLSSRARRVADIFRRVCQESDVKFVDFTFPKEIDPFAQDPGRFFDCQGMRPSAQAYSLCYRLIRSRTPLSLALEPTAG